MPTCSQSLLQTKIDSAHLHHAIDTACSDFVPSLSNHGLCLTRNGASLDTIFTFNSYMETFQSIFRPKKYHHEVQNINDERSSHHFTFFVDGNSYKDLKKGIDWNTPSNNQFKVSIHSPNDAADVRGWYNTILNLPTGYITTIKIKHSQLRSDDSIRAMEIRKRGCKFHDENNDLSSVRWYSKINCLLDCNMEYAERICGCRPWDYPVSYQVNKTTPDQQIRVCDFFGSSCFNMALEKNMASHCDSTCIPDCDETSYSISIDKEPIDPKKIICNDLEDPTTFLELELKNHIRSQLTRDVSYTGHDYVFRSPPEQRIMGLIKEILSQGNESHIADAKKAFETECTAKLESDIAAVIVSIDSPKFTRIIKSSKATTFDKLAIFGKLNTNLGHAVMVCIYQGWSHINKRNE